MLRDSIRRIVLGIVASLPLAALPLTVLPLSATGARAADDQIARGKYLVTIGICGSCHTPNLAGGRKVGNLVSANITSDSASGLGGWSEQQIVEALRNGKRPDGSDVRPPMGVFFYRDLSDTDAHAIAAYLRQVPAAPTSFQRAPVSGPPPKFGATVTSVPDTPHSDKLAYGRYVAVTVSHCMQCHTPRVGGLPDLERMGAGGNGYTGADGRTAVSANLTPGNPGGIAGWTDAQVKQAITKGVRPDGSKLVPVMDFDFYEQMTPEDLDALVGFLRSLKPVPPT
jgi:mono/diheme cytochrome c family protein